VTSHEADRARQTQAEATVRTLFAHLSAREFGDLAELLADDVEFDLAYAPEMLPMPTRGRAAVHELVENVIGGMFEPFVITITTVYPGAEPGVVVAEYASDGVVKHTGKRYLNTYAGIFRVDDSGHVTFWREYHNPEAATAAMS
jgi:ketosteroid isomerase-like protein